MDNPAYKQDAVTLRGLREPHRLKAGSLLGNLVAAIERKLTLEELRNLRERLGRLERDAREKVFGWAPELD